MDTMQTNTPIVVGIDGSRFGREALRWALAEAERRDCGVRALLVAHTAPIAAGRPTTVGLANALAARPGPEHLRPLGDTVRAVLGEHDNPRLTAEAVHGSPPEVLCSASAEAQLLVIGSHGHGQLFEAVLGTVAQYCVRHAFCPVVVIPSRLAEPAAEVVHEPVRVGAPEPLSYGLGPLL
ncbi:MAG TPA: universal stress protein [Pseudonocardiaceae bacterium]|nr:universal stress protein [Pseudonocardiaceae bacterium]